MAARAFFWMFMKIATFNINGIGARLLREHAAQIGLKASFTILDRSDAADLMNLVRHDLKQSAKKSRFPKKDTCLAIYSFAVNSGRPLEKVLAKQFPCAAEWEDDLCALFANYTEAKQSQNVEIRLLNLRIFIMPISVFVGRLFSFAQLPHDRT